MGSRPVIFTRNVDSIFRAYHALDVGTVLANEIPTFRADHMPYGGMKDSGLGREGVKYTIQGTLGPKAVGLTPVPITRADRGVAEDHKPGLIRLT